MVTVLVGLAVLLGGYLFYGRLVEGAVRPDPARVPPAIALADGVDFVVMPTWRVYLIQLLNIAGLGPVYGPIMGALWGPQVFFWVVFGCVLGGAVHDFLSGAMSMRNNGAGLPDLIGHYLGPVARQAATGFIVVLVVLVGTVFVKGPAMLIVELVPAERVGAWLGDGFGQHFAAGGVGATHWLWIVMAAIFIYYVLATLLPIDRVIGRVYPFFAAALLVMVAGLLVALLSGQLEPPPLDFANQHPAGLPAWPVIFITVSCGAVSGFHATQSPMMARCLRSETQMRLVFYGAMIAEGVIALVWAAAAQGHYAGAAALGQALASGGPGKIVNEICVATMGPIGGALAVIGVVVLPITSGDTAFRVARLIVADYLHLPQARVRNRYLIALPLFAVAIVLNFVRFDLIWRYFGWANQTLAVVTLWAGAVFLARRGQRWWLAAVPAVFMTVVTTSYILVEEVGFGLDHDLGVVLGLVIGVGAMAAFLVLRRRLPPEVDTPLQPKPSAVEREGDTLAC